MLPDNREIQRAPLSDPREVRVLVLATGRDNTLTCELLRRAGIDSQPCSTPDDLCREIEAGAGAVVLAEELLTPALVERLLDVLRRQPPWSDLPILVVAREQERPLELLKSARILGTVTIVQRPIPVDTLVSALEAALSARRRQYEVRDLLWMREQANRRKDEFLAMLGHELRNPLSPILNAVHLLRVGRQQDTFVERHAEVIERHARHLAGLVDDLLDVARITHGKVQLRKDPVLLSQVISQAAETCRPIIQQRQHRLAIELPEDPVWLDADTLRLVQVFSNLLSNAAKYTEPGGSLSVTAEAEADEVRIKVRDTGIGIPRELLPQIFQAFVQVPGVGERSQGGLGLGLAMVRMLVEMHGGTVEARSEGPGKGSEFVVRLPAVPAPPITPPGPGVSDERPEEDTSVQRVLVVDDNRDATETMAELLQLWDYAVEVAYDGISALEIARRFRPQVVLLDLTLPGKDGYEVARELRREICRDGTLLVAVTGLAQEEARRRALEAGFDQHLVKPVDPTELRQVLAQAPRIP